MSTQLVPFKEQPQTAALTPTQKWAAMLPTKDEMEYIRFLAEMIAESVLITPDLRGALKDWEPNRPLPQNHQAGDACPCLYCEQARKVKRVVVANAVAKMLRGREMGIPPLKGLEVQPIIKGKMGLSYQEMIRQLAEKGWQVDWKASTSTKTECELTFHNGNDSAQFSFTMADAQQAGYATKENRDGSPNFYQKIPDVMLLSRTVSKAYNRLTGIRVYTPEELGDFEDERPAEDRMERVERAAGVAPGAPEQADERLIPPEVESAVRDAAHAAGKIQTWASAQLAMLQGELRAAIAQDPQADVASLAKTRAGVIIENLKRAAGEKPKAPARGTARKNEPPPAAPAAAAQPAPSNSPVDSPAAATKEVPNLF
jgi:hypothetical protein